MSPFWSKPTRALIAASIVFLAFVADILIAKVQVLMGANNPVHLGDTAQFILLLVAVVLFVIGTIHQESRAESEGEEES